MLVYQTVVWSSIKDDSDHQQLQEHRSAPSSPGRLLEASRRNKAVKGESAELTCLQKNSKRVGLMGLYL